MHPQKLGPIALLLAATAAHGQLEFTDVTDAAGLGGREQVMQSLAWGDYDDDGHVDVYVTGKGANALFRNNGDGTFTDVAEEVGVVGPETLDGDSIGTVFADLDNDGDLDLYMSQINDGTDQLYRNEGASPTNGGFAFTEVHRRAGVNIQTSARGMTSLDYDRDGLLDLYILASGRNALFNNRGNWRFSDQGNELGVDPAGRDVGAVATDVNLDGWPDLFVANRTDDPTNLFINREGLFTDEAVAAGIDARGLGMGVVSFDYDNDLDFDLYWTTWPGEGASPMSNRLYRNDGNLRFTDVTEASGTADELGWGISANTADLDNDGYADLLVTNGFDPSTTPSVLYRNRGDGTFADVTEVLPSLPSDGRGVAFADYDQDGDVDIMLTAAGDEPIKLWRNDTQNENAWIQLALRGGLGNHTAVGARVIITTDAGRHSQELHGSTGRGNQSEPVLHFGLGTATAIRDMTVYWPSGQVQTVKDPTLNRRHFLFESGPQPRHYSGAWYGGPDQSGHGFSVEELDDGRFVIFWYTFDDNGERTWLVTQGRRRGGLMTGETYTIDGGAFPPNFDATQTERRPWGELTVEFADCQTATARWSTALPRFSDGEMRLQRLSRIAGTNCG